MIIQMPFAQNKKRDLSKTVINVDILFYSNLLWGYYSMKFRMYFALKSLPVPALTLNTLGLVRSHYLRL